MVEIVVVDELAIELPLVLEERRRRLIERFLNVDWLIHIIVGLDPEDFARIHNVVGVDRLLDRTHDAHSVAVLGDQKVYLAATDAVLTGAGAVER